MSTRLHSHCDEPTSPRSRTQADSQNAMQESGVAAVLTKWVKMEPENTWVGFCFVFSFFNSFIVTAPTHKTVCLRLYAGCLYIY